MLNYDSIEIGDEVKWTGSESDNETIYTVIEKYSDQGWETILVIGDGHTEYEVFLSELF